MPRIFCRPTALGLLLLATISALSPATRCLAAEPAAAASRIGDAIEKFDLVYFDDPDETAAERGFHKLDLFLPAEKRDFTTVFFIHGGAWVLGDKKDFGIYPAIGRMLARSGIGAVMINYRLSPQVKHPEHIKDVARAFAWTHKHIAEYGGRADRLIVSGHSAGGHLAALLCTDESWLRAEGLSLADVRGAVPISGVYEIPPGMFKAVFGDDAEAHRTASPLRQVHAGCPPFLVLFADRDFPLCGAVSEAFAAALRGKGVAADCQQIDRRNHIDILGRLRFSDDPCGRRCWSSLPSTAPPKRLSRRCGSPQSEKHFRMLARVSLGPTWAVR